MANLLDCKRESLSAILNLWMLLGSLSWQFWNLVMNGCGHWGMKKNCIFQKWGRTSLLKSALLVIFLCTWFCYYVSYSVIRVFLFFGLVPNYQERCLSEILSWLLNDKSSGRLVHEKICAKVSCIKSICGYIASAVSWK